MRRILLAAALLVAPTAAHAQIGGMYTPQRYGPPVNSYGPGGPQIPEGRPFVLHDIQRVWDGASGTWVETRARYLIPGPLGQLPDTVRVAGGWVRNRASDSPRPDW